MPGYYRDEAMAASFQIHCNLSCISHPTIRRYVTGVSKIGSQTSLVCLALAAFSQAASSVAAVHLAYISWFWLHIYIYIYIDICGNVEYDCGIVNQNTDTDVYRM
jgi:hypothetical protein